MANVHPTGTDSAELSIGTTYPAMMSSLAFATVHVTWLGKPEAGTGCVKGAAGPVPAVRTSDWFEDQSAGVSGPAIRCPATSRRRLGASAATAQGPCPPAARRPLRCVCRFPLRWYVAHRG